MSATKVDPTPATAPTSEQLACHVVCGRDNWRALCGHTISVLFADDRPTDCVVCDDLDRLNYCPHFADCDCLPRFA